MSGRAPFSGALWVDGSRPLAPYFLGPPLKAFTYTGPVSTTTVAPPDDPKNRKHVRTATVRDGKRLSPLARLVLHLLSIDTRAQQVRSGTGSGVARRALARFAGTHYTTLSETLDSLALHTPLVQYVDAGGNRLFGKAGKRFRLENPTVHGRPMLHNTGHYVSPDATEWVALVSILPAWDGMTHVQRFLLYLAAETADTGGEFALSAPRAAELIGTTGREVERAYTALSSWHGLRPPLIANTGRLAADRTAIRSLSLPYLPAPDSPKARSYDSLYSIPDHWAANRLHHHAERLAQHWPPPTDDLEAHPYLSTSPPVENRNTTNDGPPVQDPVQDPVGNRNSIPVGNRNNSSKTLNSPLGLPPSKALSTPMALAATFVYLERSGFGMRLERLRGQVEAVSRSADATRLMREVNGNDRKRTAIPTNAIASCVLVARAATESPDGEAFRARLAQLTDPR